MLGIWVGARLRLGAKGRGNKVMEYGKYGIWHG